MMNKYLYRSAGQIYRVEVCNSEEVTEMQRMSNTQKHAWRTASLYNHYSIYFNLIFVWLIEVQDTSILPYLMTLIGSNR